MPRRSGQLAYQSAWLKQYHPVEYYAALFNNQPMGFYSVDVLVRDASRHDVGVSLPDIEASDTWCTVEGKSVRVGLGFIREWGSEVAEAVVAERVKNGSYRSLGDLVRRAPPGLSRTAIDNLVWVGGCDRFGLSRRELLWQVGFWLPPKNDRGNGKRVRRQLELALDHPHEHVRFAGVAEDERLLAEYKVLGFAASGHPLKLLRGTLPSTVVPSTTLASIEHGATVDVAGMAVARQRPSTAKGFVFLLIEDEGGMINVIVRPDVYERDRVVVRGEPFVWVTGKLAKDDGTLNVIAEVVRPLKVKVARTMPEVPPQAASRIPYSFLKTMRSVAPGSKDWG